MWAFGNSWKERNRFEEYYSGILDAIYASDWDELGKLRDELTTDQYLYIWKHLASYTKAKVPKELS